MIELIYHTNCPNIEQTRRHIIEAMERSGKRTQWIEWNTDHVETPNHLKHLGSPTILVQGRDVAGFSPNAAHCRVYPTLKGLSGVPPVEMIQAALNTLASNGGNLQVTE